MLGGHRATERLQRLVHAGLDIFPVLGRAGTDGNVQVAVPDMAEEGNGPLRPASVQALGNLTHVLLHVAHRQGDVEGIEGLKSRTMCSRSSRIFQMPCLSRSDWAMTASSIMPSSIPCSRARANISASCCWSEPSDSMMA